MSQRKTKRSHGENVRFAANIDSDANLGYNDIKVTEGGLINEQNIKDSGLLADGRKTSAVSGSKNNQRQYGENPKNRRKIVENVRKVGDGYGGKSGHYGKTKSWLSGRKFLTQKDILRFGETLFRNRAGKLESTDINGKTVPSEVLKAFEKTIFTDEKGHLITFYHWTSNIFSAFKYGDLGFHFGTFKSAYDRRESKIPEKRGSDVVVFAKGTIESPNITKIIKFNLKDESELDTKRRNLYEIARRGVQPKAGEILNIYYKTNFIGGREHKRNSIKSVGNNYRLGVKRSSSEIKANPIIEFYVNEDENTVTYIYANGESVIEKLSINEPKKARRNSIEPTATESEAKAEAQ